MRDAARGIILVIVCALAGSSIVSCREAPATDNSATALAASPGVEWVRTELYFGLTRRDGSLIDDSQWQRFVDEQITPRFPDGLSIYHTDGQYLDTKKVLHKEASRVVVIFYPPSAAKASSESISKIVAAYVSQFDQETVLRVDVIEKAALLDAAAVSHP